MDTQLSHKLSRNEFDKLFFESLENIGLPKDFLGETSYGFENNQESNGRAWYDPKKKRVVFNTAHLSLNRDDSFELVQKMHHELGHAFQHYYYGKKGLYFPIYTKHSQFKENNEYFSRLNAFEENSRLVEYSLGKRNSYGLLENIYQHSQAPTLTGNSKKDLANFTKFFNKTNQEFSNLSFPEQSKILRQSFMDLKIDNHVTPTIDNVIKHFTKNVMPTRIEETTKLLGIKNSNFNSIFKYAEETYNKTGDTTRLSLLNAFIKDIKNFKEESYTKYYESGQQREQKRFLTRYLRFENQLSIEDKTAINDIIDRSFIVMKKENSLQPRNQNQNKLNFSNLEHTMNSAVNFSRDSDIKYFETIKNKSLLLSNIVGVGETQRLINRLETDLKASIDSNNRISRDGFNNIFANNTLLLNSTEVGNAIQDLPVNKSMFKNISEYNKSTSNITEKSSSDNKLHSEFEITKDDQDLINDINAQDVKNEILPEQQRYNDTLSNFIDEDESLESNQASTLEEYYKALDKERPGSRFNSYTNSLNDTIYEDENLESNLASSPQEYYEALENEQPIAASTSKSTEYVNNPYVDSLEKELKNQEKELNDTLSASKGKTLSKKQKKLLNKKIQSIQNKIEATKEKLDDIKNGNYTNIDSQKDIEGSNTQKHETPKNTTKKTLYFDSKHQDEYKIKDNNLNTLNFTESLDVARNNIKLRDSFVINPNHADKIDQSKFNNFLAAVDKIENKAIRQSKKDSTPLPSKEELLQTVKEELLTPTKKYHDGMYPSTVGYLQNGYVSVNTDTNIKSFEILTNHRILDLDIPLSEQDEDIKNYLDGYSRKNRSILQSVNKMQNSLGLLNDEIRAPLIDMGYVGFKQDNNYNFFRNTNTSARQLTLKDSPEVKMSGPEFVKDIDYDKFIDKPKEYINSPKKNYDVYYAVNPEDITESGIALRGTDVNSIEHSFQGNTFYGTEEDIKDFGKPRLLITASREEKQKIENIPAFNELRQSLEIDYNSGRIDSFDSYDDYLTNLKKELKKYSEFKDPDLTKALNENKITISSVKRLKGTLSISDDELIHLDKPLSEQSEKVRDFFAKYDIDDDLSKTMENWRIKTRTVGASDADNDLYKKLGILGAKNGNSFTLFRGQATYDAFKPKTITSIHKDVEGSSLISNQDLTDINLLNKYSRLDDDEIESSISRLKQQIEAGGSELYTHKRFDSQGKELVVPNEKLKELLELREVRKRQGNYSISKDKEIPIDKDIYVNPSGKKKKGLGIDLASASKWQKEQRESSFGADFISNGFKPDYDINGSRIYYDSKGNKIPKEELLINIQQNRPEVQSPLTAEEELEFRKMKAEALRTNKKVSDVVIEHKYNEEKINMDSGVKTTGEKAKKIAEKVTKAGHGKAVHNIVTVGAGALIGAGLTYLAVTDEDSR